MNAASNKTAFAIHGFAESEETMQIWNILQIHQRLEVDFSSYFSEAPLENGFIIFIYIVSTYSVSLYRDRHRGVGGNPPK